MNQSTQLDKPLYYPNGIVTLFHYREFYYSIDENLDLIYYKVSPVAGVGLLLFFFMLFWSCCRTCNCCRYRQSRRETSKNCISKVFAACTIIITLGSCVLLYFGMQSNSDQKQYNLDFLNIVKHFTDKILGVAYEIGNIVHGINNGITLVSSEAFSITYADMNISITNNSITNNSITNNSITNNSITNTTNSDYLKLLTDSLRVSHEKATIVETSIVKFTDSVKDFYNNIKSAIDMSESKRNIIMLIIVYSTTALIFFQGIIALMNGFCRRKFQPRKGKRCLWLWGSVTFIVLISFFILFGVSGVLLGVTTITSDFCIKPQENLMKKITTNSTASYYIHCLYNNNTHNPNEQDIYDLKVAVNDTLNIIKSPQGNLCKESDKCKGIYAQLIGNITNVYINVIAITDSFGCASIGNEINNVLSLICVDFVENVAFAFEILLAFACALVLIEFVRRLFPFLHVDDATVNHVPIVEETAEREYAYVVTDLKVYNRKPVNIFDNSAIKESKV